MKIVENRLSRVCQAGFTLIEIMMVMIIISLILTPLIYWYSVYEKQRKMTLTKERVEQAYQKLVDFKKFNNFYPLPAGLEQPRPEYTGAAATSDTYGRALIPFDRTLVMSDSAATAVRSQLTSISNGSCADISITAGSVQGVCSQESARLDTSTQPVSGVPASQRRVIIGMLPFRDINIKESEAYDAYGSRLVYAVSYPLTARDTFRETLGMIKVSRKDATAEIDLSDTVPGAFQILVFSVGPDKKGGYTMNGLSARSCSGEMDSENCDFLTGEEEAHFLFNDGSKVAGTEFDDYLVINSTTDRSPWLIGDTPNDIVYNQNRPIVIGNFLGRANMNPWSTSAYQGEVDTSGMPGLRLQIGLGSFGIDPSKTISTGSSGNVQNWSDGMMYVQNKVIVDKICDPRNPSTCMRLGQLERACPDGEYVTGIGVADGQKRVRCGRIYFGCDSNAKYLKEIDSNGKAVCVDIPPPAPPVSGLSSALANALANAVANAILANGGTISDAINAVANTIINAGGSAAQVGSAIGTIVNANSAAAGGQTAAQLAWNYVAGQPGGTLTTAQQIIIVANAGRGAGASVTDTLSQIGSVINGAGGSANQVAAVVGQAGTALGATTEQLNAAANNIMNNVYGTTTNSSTFQAAVQYYAGNNSNAITGGDASTLGTIGSNGSGVPSLNGTTTATSGGTFSSGITGSTGTVVNTGGSAVNGIVTGGTYIVGAATGSSTSGSTSGSGSSLSDAGDAIAGILGSAGISSTSTVNGIIGRIGTGTGLSAEDSSALGSAIDSASSSIDLSGSSGSGSGSSGSGGSSGSSGSSSSGSSGSSGSSSSSSSGTPVTCNSVNIDRSKYNYCDNRAESFSRQATDLNFNGMCLLTNTEATGECGSRQYQLELATSCPSGDLVLARSAQTLAQKIDNTGGCCAFDDSGPAQYRDRYTISCRNIAKGSENGSLISGDPNLILKSGSRGLSANTQLFNRGDNGNRQADNNGSRDYLAYRSNENVTVTRKMSKANCSMNPESYDWSACTAVAPSTLGADGRWWDDPGSRGCDPDGSGPLLETDGYKPFFLPKCVQTIEENTTTTDINNRGKFDVIIHNYSFPASRPSGNTSVDPKYNCIPKDQYTWNYTYAAGSDGVQARLIRAGVDRETSIPLAGPLDPGSTCTPGDTNRCQVSVGAGKYDSYDNCKCVTEMKPLRRMTNSEMTQLLTRSTGACTGYPLE
jgi:prepilin-type N-terminal cleavage/methylation domain-containing protein